MYLFMYLFIYLFVYLFIYLFTYVHRDPINMHPFYLVLYFRN